jgi:hypothetical protein
MHELNLPACDKCLKLHVYECVYLKKSLCFWKSDTKHDVLDLVKMRAHSSVSKHCAITFAHFIQNIPIDLFLLFCAL